MAVKPENTFIGGVHKHLPADIYRMKTNNPYVAGIPDCYYSGNKGELWAEYKFIAKLPARVPVKIELSALQFNWLCGRHAEGRNVAVIVGCPEGGVVLRTNQCVEMTTAEFLSQVISRQSIAVWIARQTSKR